MSWKRAQERREAERRIERREPARTLYRSAWERLRTETTESNNSTHEE